VAALPASEAIMLRQTLEDRRTLPVRAGRLEGVLAALDERACAPEGSVPPLDLAIRDFRLQLAHARELLGSAPRR